MKCQKCKKKDATYETPGKWCDSCWADWWFADYTPKQRLDAEPFLLVCQAYCDLGRDTGDDEMIRHIINKVTKGIINPQKIREALVWYKEFKKDPEGKFKA